MPICFPKCDKYHIIYQKDTPLLMRDYLLKEISQLAFFVLAGGEYLIFLFSVIVHEYLNERSLAPKYFWQAQRDIGLQQDFSNALPSQPTESARALLVERTSMPRMLDGEAMYVESVRGHRYILKIKDIL